jgi:hypothetical protein
MSKLTTAFSYCSSKIDALYHEMMRPSFSFYFAGAHCIGQVKEVIELPLSHVPEFLVENAYKTLAYSETSISQCAAMLTLHPKTAIEDLKDIEEFTNQMDKKAAAKIFRGNDLFYAHRKLNLPPNTPCVFVRIGKRGGMQKDGFHVFLGTKKSFVKKMKEAQAKVDRYDSKYQKWRSDTESKRLFPVHPAANF